MSCSDILEPGHYAYCSHTLLLDGNIVECFVGRWEQPEEEENSRRLHKYPPGSEVDGGMLMYVLRLKKPITVEAYREIHHPSIRPLVPNPEEDIKLLLMTSDVVCTLPNAM